MENEFLTVPEVAKLLNTSVTYVRKIIKSGSLRAKMVGHKYLVTRSVLNQWVTEPEISHSQE